MEPHMIENYIHYVFAFEFNHVDFIFFLTLTMRNYPAACGAWFALTKMTILAVKVS
jgi:hypothetical protein